MHKNPLNKGMIEENADGIGEVSASMVEERAKELALIAARPVTAEDTEQALRELTGGDEKDANQTMLESLAEDDRWAAVPKSTGHQVEESADTVDDEDGESAQLFQEGVNEAAHDQMLLAAIAAEKERPSET